MLEPTSLFDQTYAEAPFAVRLACWPLHAGVADKEIVGAVVTEIVVV